MLVGFVSIRKYVEELGVVFVHCSPTMPFFIQYRVYESPEKVFILCYEGFAVVVDCVHLVSPALLL